MKLSELLFFLVTFFDKREQLIEYHSQYTQNNNAEHDVIQPEHLTAVNDQVTQPSVGCQKFTDNDANEAEADVDFQVADDGGDTGRKDNVPQNVFAGTAKGFN